MNKDYTTQENLGDALKSSSLVVVQFLILNVAGIIYLATAARFLSKLDMSLLLIASVIVNLFTTLFTFAYNFTASKYIANLLTFDNKRAISFAKLVVLLSIICGFSSLTIGYVLTYLILAPFHVNYYYILLVTIDGSINSLLYFFYGILFGFFEFKKAVISFSIASASRYLFSSIAILSGSSILEILQYWLLGDSLGLIFFVIFSKKILFTNANIDKEAIQQFKSSIKFSLPLYISSIISYIYLYIDRYLILYNVGLSNYALYGTAITASLILMNLPQLITNALLPHFSYTLSENRDEFISLVSSTIRVICTTLAPLIIALSMLAEPVMYIFAGPGYVEGWFIFFIVTLAIGLTFPVASLTSALLALNKSNIVLYSNGAAIIIGAISTQVLYTQLGINGAAIGRALLFFMNFILISLWIYIRERNAYSASFHIKTSIIAILLYSPLLLLGIFSIKINIYLFLSLIVIFSLMYILILAKYRLISEKDIQSLSLIFPIRIGKYIFYILNSLLGSQKIINESLNKKIKYVTPPSYVYIHAYIKTHME